MKLLAKGATNPLRFIFCKYVFYFLSLLINKYNFVFRLNFPDNQDAVMTVLEFF